MTRLVTNELWNQSDNNMLTRYPTSPGKQNKVYDCGYHDKHPYYKPEFIYTFTVMITTVHFSDSGMANDRKLHECHECYTRATCMIEHE